MLRAQRRLHRLHRGHQLYRLHQRCPLLPGHHPRGDHPLLRNHLLHQREKPGALPGVRLQQRVPGPERPGSGLRHLFPAHRLQGHALLQLHGQLPGRQGERRRRILPQRQPRPGADLLRPRPGLRGIRHHPVHRLRHPGEQLLGPGGDQSLPGRRQRRHLLLHRQRARRLLHRLRVQHPLPGPHRLQPGPGALRPALCRPGHALLRLQERGQLRRQGLRSQELLPRLLPLSEPGLLCPGLRLHRHRGHRLHRLERRRGQVYRHRLRQGGLRHRVGRGAVLLHRPGPGPGSGCRRLQRPVPGRDRLRPGPGALRPARRLQGHALLRLQERGQLRRQGLRLQELLPRLLPLPFRRDLRPRLRLHRHRGDPLLRLEHRRGQVYRHPLHSGGLGLRAGPGAVLLHRPEPGSGPGQRRLQRLLPGRDRRRPGPGAL